MTEKRVALEFAEEKFRAREKFPPRRLYIGYANFWTTSVNTSSPEALDFQFKACISVSAKLVELACEFDVYRGRSRGAKLLKLQ